MLGLHAPFAFVHFFCNLRYKEGLQMFDDVQLLIDEDRNRPCFFFNSFDKGRNETNGGIYARHIERLR